LPPRSTAPGAWIPQRVFFRAEFPDRLVPAIARTPSPLRLNVLRSSRTA
jgi:hypothetical protein